MTAFALRALASVSPPDLADELIAEADRIDAAELIAALAADMEGRA